MTQLIEDWYNDKEKTYWKTWESNDTSHPIGTWSWVLFFCPADLYPTYHYGITGSEEEAKSEIRWAIGAYLERQKLL